MSRRSWLYHKIKLSLQQSEQFKTEEAVPKENSKMSKKTNDSGLCRLYVDGEYISFPVLLLRAS
jgi:hypothetical protein